MYGRVDPATALGDEDVPAIGRDRHGLRVGRELGLVVWEVLEDERRQVPIFAKGEQVFFVQRVQVALWKAHQLERESVPRRVKKRTSEYSSMISELTRRGFPLSADLIRYMVKLRPPSQLAAMLREGPKASAPSRQTGYGAEQAFEGLRHVVTDKVLID